MESENAIHWEPIYTTVKMIAAGKEKVEEAIVHFLTVINIDPENVVAHNNLGAAFYSQDNLEEAHKHFSEALRLQPDDDDVRSNLEMISRLLETSESNRL